MERLGKAFSKHLRGGDMVYFQGELGAGKTTLVRGVLAGMGHNGSVTSPTYTLIEPYECDDLTIYHLDLYRLEDAEELETIGLRDLVNKKSILLVEWPDRGEGILPLPTINISIEYSHPGRNLEINAKDGRVFSSTPDRLV